jgi:hypothetical protein
MVSFNQDPYEWPILKHSRIIIHDPHKELLQIVLELHNST